MKRNDAFPSTYVNQGDIGRGTVVVTIEDVRLEQIKGDHGMEDKPIMYFVDDVLKPLIVNNTNFQAIEESYGAESDDWRGKVIEVYVDPGITFGGKRTGGVRVRIPSSSGVKQAAGGGGNGITWNWEEAQQYASEAGIDVDTLKAMLKAEGRTAYNALKDTKLVQQLINAKTGAEDSNAAPPDDDIPF